MPVPVEPEPGDGGGEEEMIGGEALWSPRRLQSNGDMVSAFHRPWSIIGVLSFVTKVFPPAFNSSGPTATRALCEAVPTPMAAPACSLPSSMQRALWGRDRPVGVSVVPRVWLRAWHRVGAQGMVGEWVNVWLSKWVGSG